MKKKDDQRLPRRRAPEREGAENALGRRGLRASIQFTRRRTRDQYSQWKEDVNKKKLRRVGEI